METNFVPKEPVFRRFQRRLVVVAEQIERYHRCLLVST